jgi:hypothetical protein
MDARGGDEMPVGPVIERRDVRGRSLTVENYTITPVARSLFARWPGGGSVWSGPAAVVVEGGGSIERIPIGNISGRILWAMRVGTVALIAAWIVKDRRRRRSDD